MRRYLRSGKRCFTSSRSRRFLDMLRTASDRSAYCHEGPLRHTLSLLPWWCTKGGDCTTKFFGIQKCRHFRTLAMSTYSERRSTLRRLGWRFRLWWAPLRINWQAKCRRRTMRWPSRYSSLVDRSCFNSWLFCICEIHTKLSTTRNHGSPIVDRNLNISTASMCVWNNSLQIIIAKGSSSLTRKTVLNHRLSHSAIEYFETTLNHYCVIDEPIVGIFCPQMKVVTYEDSFTT